MSALISYASRDLLMVALAGIIAAELDEAVRIGGKATLAVPGGTTPGPLFVVLSGADIDWGKVTILLTDERWVPENSDRSNTALVRQRLLQNRASKARFVTFDALEATPEEGLARLSAKLINCLPLTVCLLGMGGDKHTASLFPDGDLLSEALSENAPPLVPMRATGAPEPRLTLSAPVLKAARHIHLLLTGSGKKAALEEAYIKGPVEEAPVRVILGQAQVHYAA